MLWPYVHVLFVITFIVWILNKDVFPSEPSYFPQHYPGNPLQVEEKATEKHRVLIASHSMSTARPHWLCSLWVCHKQTMDRTIASSTLRTAKSPTKARMELSAPQLYVLVIKEDAASEVCLSAWAASGRGIELFRDLRCHRPVVIGRRRRKWGMWALVSSTVWNKAQLSLFQLKWYC